MHSLRLIVSASVLTISIICSAVTPWSLDSCINYALTHNLAVRSAMLDNLGAEYSVNEAKDRFLPSLSAGASQSWDFGRSLTSENTYANRNISNFGWNVQMSLPLFQGLSAVRQLRQAKASLAASHAQTEAVRDEVVLSVINYYLQALYNRELLAVAGEQLRLSDKQFQRQRDLFEAGKVPEVDVIQIHAQVKAAEADSVSAAATYRLSLLDLAQALELQCPDDFDVIPLATHDALPPLPKLSTVTEHALANYSTVRAARASVIAADEGISLARSGYLPQLYFNAGLSDSYFRSSGMMNPSFRQQMRDNFSKSVGFSLRVPIFDAFSTRNSVRRAQLARRSALLEVERQETNLRKAVEQAWTQADGARSKYLAMEYSAEAARKALEAMDDKYNYGKANASEWEQAWLNYITALSRRVQAKYESILRTRILKFYSR